MIKPTWFFVAVSLFSPVALAETSLGEQRSSDTPAHSFKCGYSEALEKLGASGKQNPTVITTSDGTATAINGN
ncbi:MAG: hypothetical protein JNL01_04890 [Bdellovibrionales bacterium]|nr:hypothetical protein [Bdellovibrionales bacterium]